MAIYVKFVRETNQFSSFFEGKKSNMFLSKNGNDAQALFEFKQYVYIADLETLHDGLKICILSSCGESDILLIRSVQRKIFRQLTTEDKINIFAPPFLSHPSIYTVQWLYPKKMETEGFRDKISVNACGKLS